MEEITQPKEKKISSKISATGNGIHLSKKDQLNQFSGNQVSSTNNEFSREKKSYKDKKGGLESVNNNTSRAEADHEASVQGHGRPRAHSSSRPMSRSRRHERGKEIGHGKIVKSERKYVVS